MAGVMHSTGTGLPMPSISGNSPSRLLKTSFHGRPLAAVMTSSSTARNLVANSWNILCRIDGVEAVKARDAQLKGTRRQLEKSDHLEVGYFDLGQSQRKELQSCITVKKPPFYSAIPNFFLDILENTLIKTMYGSEKPENYYMQRNYGPVEEFGPERVLSVKGSLPIGDLSGKKGLVTLLLAQLRVALGVIDLSNGYGTANTALAFHNGKLLTLSEADKPYVIWVLENGDFETAMRLDYDGKLNHPFTAHPKLDPNTGELFMFGYQIEALPYVTYRVISKDGVMGDPIPITLSGPIMMHDFAITEKYAIFMDHPLYFQPKDMVKKNQDAFSFDDTKPARFGVLPRYAKNESEMKWFELSSCFVFHNANAWEEGDEVVLISCRVSSVNLSTIVDYDKVKCEAFANELWEYRFNLKTGKAIERKLGDSRADFPRINEEYVGRKNQFVYLAVMEDATHNIGVVKYDLTKEPELQKAQLEVGGNVAGVFWHGSLRYGSEPVYVPKNPKGKGDEDDGYLLNFVFDENIWKSELIVIDAKTMSSEPIAVIELPSRVPYGFHGIFLSEEQLQSQKA